MKTPRTRKRHVVRLATGKRLRAIAVAAVAAACSVSKSTVRRWIRGGSTPSGFYRRQTGQMTWMFTRLNCNIHRSPTFESKPWTPGQWAR